MLSSLAGFATAFSGVASYFSVPTLGGLYKVPKSVDLGPLFTAILDLFSIGMPVYPDKYEESGGTEIGTQVLVGGMDGSDAGAVGALTKIMDNVVVRPRSWKIHGFIGLNLENQGVLRVGATFGGLPFITSFVRQFGRELLNLGIKRYLRYVTEARRPFKFTTADGETIPALIQSYRVNEEADNLNWVDVDLDIMEFRFVGLSPEGDQVVIGSGSDVSAMSNLKQLTRATLSVVGMRL